MTNTNGFNEKCEIVVLPKKHISNAAITLSPTSYTYDGSEKKPTVTVQYQDTILRTDKDYTVAYTNNKDAGTASVTITGAGNYTGTKTTSFSINKADLSQATLSLSLTSYTYDGTAKTPSITVKMGNNTLQVGTDYSVQYADNTNVGTATVMVTGKGNYSGTAKVTFKINPAPTPTPKPAVKTITTKLGTYKVAPNGKSVELNKVKTTSASVKVPNTVKDNYGT